MNILLPVSLCSANPTNNPSECRSAKHELSASNGCYTWEISHPHLISMQPSKVRGKCVDSIILQPLIHRESKTLIQIIAKDQSSGQVLESQAKVGLIDRLAININYRHFYINDKKHIQVVAYDEEGNIFSGLDGFRFDWTLISGTENLKIIQKPEGYIHKQADCTDVSFLKGLKAGSADLKVQILEPGYEHIKSVQVNILVIDPFIIEPQKQVFLCPTSLFKYELIRLRKQDIGEVQRNPIKLPNSQYMWSISTPSFGKINQDGSFISGTVEGIQNILVVDQQMVNNTAETQLQVVQPYKIIMSIYDVSTQSGKVLNESLSKVFEIQQDQPSMSNILVEDRLYLILLSLEDKDGNKITLTENLVFQSFSLLDQQWIEKVQVNKIGSEILFKTRKIDTQMKKMITSYKLSQIQSQSTGEVYDFSQFAQHLNVEAELILTKPVKILHPTNLILLPYLHQEYQRQIWKTSAEGGSGVYLWSVEHPDVIQIEGSVTLKAQNVGQTRLQVKDHRNHQNYQYIDVEVALITQLKWLEEQLELRAADSSISQIIQAEKSLLHLIAFDRQGRKFTNCTSAQFSYNTYGEGITILPPSLININYSLLTQQLSEDEMFKLIMLQQQFNENPNKIFVQDLTNSVQMTKELMLYNNFGICSQVEIQAKNEGLSRLKATQSVQDCAPNQKVTESEFAQIAVYKVLKTSLPDLSLQFIDLYSSKNQNGQEFKNFDQFFKNNLITLLPGTEVTWQVVGGTNFWSDYIDRYNVEWIVIDLKDSKQNTKSLQISKQNETTTKFDIRIRCAQNQDLEGISQFKVTMLQNSKQSRNLLKPAHHSVEINVECGAPKSQRLLWSQSETKIEKFLPQLRILNDERIYFALVGSNHTVKTILFDQENLSYLNSSSVIQDVKSSDDRIATVQISDAKFESAVKNQKYSKRSVQFYNQTGTVYLKSTTNFYIDSVLQKSNCNSYYSSCPIDESAWKLGQVTPITTKLTDQIKVQVVNELQVEPKYKSIYIGNKDSFKLTILEGSGFFSVKGDSQLADIVHINRQIYITPKKNGLLDLEVFDIEIPDCKAAKAQILISDIEKISLQPPYALIEQHNYMILNVSTFDSKGNQFDADQQSYMRFNIETQNIGLKTKETSINTQFKAIGFEHGTYQLTASIRRNNQNNYPSENTIQGMSKLQVFPQLQIFPNELLLTPNMKYTLQILGGPQNSSHFGYIIQTKFDNEQVAEIDQNEVTGIQVGDSDLHYKIISLKTGEVVCNKTIPIRVRLITDIEIPLTNQRQIYSESLIKMNVVLKYGKEYFNHGIAPISYKWNTTSKHVLSLQLPNENLVPNNKQIISQLMNNQDKNVQFTTDFNSSSIYAIAGVVGDSIVTIQVAIQYPNLYKSEQNWFYQTALVKVVSQLQIQVNEFSTLQSSQATHMYLIPPNSIGQIKSKTDSKLKLRYSIFSVYDHQKNSYASQETTSLIVKLVNNTAIQTFDKHGKVTVVVEQDDQFQSDQVAMLNVFITNIYSILVMDTYESLNLPFESTQILPIHFQNERAHRFANNIEGIKIEFSVSHPKIVSIQIDEFSQTLTVFGQGEGECNILIYLKNQPDIFDVIKVRVSSLVQPISPIYLHIGGEVEFRILMNERSEQTFWKSNQTQILQIDHLNGIATGISEGKAEITISDQITSPTVVQVGKITSGQIDSKDNIALSQDNPELRIRIKMFFQNNNKEVMPSQQYKDSTLIRQNIGLNCYCDYPDFVKVTSEVTEKGFFCLLKLKQIENQKPKPKYVRINVEAFGKIPNSQTPIYTSQIASFKVELNRPLLIENKYKDGIKIQDDKRDVNIKIFSSSEFSVEILNGNDKQIHYKITKEEQYSHDYNLNLKVSEYTDQKFQTSVVLTNKDTKQQLKIPLSFSLKDDFKSTEDESYIQYKNRSLSEYVILTIVVLISIEFVLSNWWQISLFNLFRKNNVPQNQQQRRNQNLYQKQNINQPINQQGHLPTRLDNLEIKRNNLNYSRTSLSDRSQHQSIFKYD